MSDEDSAERKGWGVRRDAVTPLFFMQFAVRLWLAQWAAGTLPACIGGKTTKSGGFKRGFEVVQFVC